MAQVTDRNIGANPTGFDMRTEINNIIAALESDNSGSSEPLNPVAYMKWLDTSNVTYYYYKERNHDNTAWVTLFRYTVATKIMEAVSNGVVLDDSLLVHKTGNETIAGVKTFSSSPIVPNATTDTQVMAYGQGVNLTAAQTVAGVKTFSSSPLLPVPTLANQAISMGNIIEKTGSGIGYGTGSGGTVTQLTSKSTDVTLNKPSGRIGTHSASLSAGAEVSFIFNNTFISTEGDTILLQECFVGAFPNKYTITSKAISTGSCFVNIKNNTVGSLSETVYINFSIIKGAIA